METVGRRGQRTLAAATLLAATLVALGRVAAPAAAQDPVDRDCRCVDRDGNEIERCTCIRMPRLDDRAFGLVHWGEPRARIGVTLDGEQDASFDARGARVRDVLEDGPADRAGIRAGDVIVSLDGHALAEPLGPEVDEDFDLDASVPVQRLRAIARDLEAGTDVEVEYERDGERHATTLEPEAVPGFVGSFEAMAPRWDPNLLDERLRNRTSQEPRFFYRGPEEQARVLALGRGGRFEQCPSYDATGVLALGDRCVGGLELVSLNPELGSYFGTSEGVLVADVHDDSPIGLEPGDVILAVGDREVDMPERVRRILASYEAGEPVTFRIMRDRTEMSVSGRLTR